MLCDSFTTPRVEQRNNFRVPAIEQVRAVWQAAAEISPCAVAVWGLMAETGARLDHLLRARLDGLQLDRRRLLLSEVEGPKRQPLVFLTKGAARYMRDAYLPWREEFVKKYGASAGGCSPARRKRSTAGSVRRGRGLACRGSSRDCCASSTRSGC